MVLAGKDVLDIGAATCYWGSVRTKLITEGEGQTISGDFLVPSTMEVTVEVGCVSARAWGPSDIWSWWRVSGVNQILAVLVLVRNASVPPRQRSNAP